MQSFAPLMFTLLAERALLPTLMALLCAERPARSQGLFPRKGAMVPGSDADLLVLERGEFRVDEVAIRDREDARWSLYYGRALRARVAATYLHGAPIWDDEDVLAHPGTSRFMPRRHANLLPEAA